MRENDHAIRDNSHVADPNLYQVRAFFYSPGATRPVLPELENKDSRTSLLKTRSTFSGHVLTVQFGQLLVKRRQDDEEITDETVVGDLKNRRFFIFVDGDDNLRVLHSG
jgi:hypothetical protein